ncbi:MAG: diguanylate cyclase [Defluviitaleaceae bacterium]|nr:diguanylate cyclase [Defluviitaleaceae bacterium]
MDSIQSKKNSVLLVDDEIINLTVLEKLLAEEYILHKAKNGKEALQQAVANRPDVIILDVVMPGIDGYQVIEELKQIPIIRDIPVIFLTGLSGKGDEAKGLALGAVDYIQKPFNDVIVKLRVQTQLKIVNAMRTIESLSNLDQLTGIANRRAFTARMEYEWIRAVRQNSEISLIIIDIDNFKHYNDTYGHIQGDMALKSVADCMNNIIRRKTDFIARWGGEEFVVLMPLTPPEGAFHVAEVIRREIETTQIPHAGGSQSVTVSIGVQTVYPNKDSRIDDLITDADSALYQAKRMGRNQVCVFEAI